MKVFTLRLAYEMYDKIKAIAKQRGYTTTQLIKHILWDWLKANEK